MVEQFCFEVGSNCPDNLLQGLIFSRTLNLQLDISTYFERFLVSFERSKGKFVAMSRFSGFFGRSVPARHTFPIGMAVAAKLQHLANSMTFATQTDKCTLRN